MPYLFTPEEYVDMLLIYGECLKNRRISRQLYQERFPNRHIPSEATFKNLERSLRQGHFPNNKRDTIERAVRCEQTIINVLSYVNFNPKVSIRTLANEVGISRSSVHRILKDFKYHPFKVHLVQGLQPGDDQRRLDFIARMMLKINDDPHFLSKILWSDEARFHNNGVVNRHNSNYWSPMNPHWVMETRFQNIWGINVWCGLFNHSVIGPYFFDGTLTGVRYLDFLENILPDLLEDIPLNERQEMWLQQDGAPPHNARIVSDHLQNRFENRWIANRSPEIMWAARSPDLSPLDFFFWGAIKDIVYQSEPQNLDELKQNITRACRQITPAMIQATCTRNVLTRFEMCIAAGGLQFEHLM